MGQGFNMVCPKCGYGIEAWLGVGMMYPLTYEKTIAAAEIGALGEQMANFLQEHPDGAIDASYVVGRCKKCGELENLMDLSMYLPKENFKPDKPKGRWSASMPFEEAEYVSPWDLEEPYELFARYPHRCKKCGGEMKLFTEETIGRIKCPRCKLRLEETAPPILWD